MITGVLSSEVDFSDYPLVLWKTITNPMLLGFLVVYIVLIVTPISFLIYKNRKSESDTER